MASLNVSRASNQLLSATFLKAVALLVAGYVASIVITGWMRDNVMDIGMRGGDAVYGLVASALFLMLPLGTRNARYLALGSSFGSGLTVYQELTGN